MPHKRQSTGRTATAASSSSRQPSKQVKRSSRTPQTDVQTSQANQYPALASQPDLHVQATQQPALAPKTAPYMQTTQQPAFALLFFLI